MKAIKILIPMLCIALLFSGCGGFHLASSIDDLISPVAPAGADASVQSAMDAYCKGGYSVKIPAAGNYTTSYIFYDFDDDGQKEALAFYEPNDALGKIDMAVLEQSGENWQVIANIQGEGTDVYSVDFCDVNGDGKTVVTLNVYTLDYSAGDTQTESDAYLTMAGTTKLATDVAGGLSSVFLLYDPAGFQENTGALRYLDGTLPEAGSDSDWWNMVYRWTDCPVLTRLDLGEYRADTTHARGGDSQTYLADFYVGMRGAWNTGTEENLAGGEELWQALTAGAVSTVEAEG